MMPKDLSSIAYAMLTELSSGPIPTQEINPGLINKFCNEGLVEIAQVASPYKSHKGRPIAHAKLTEKGEAAARRHAGEVFG